MKNGQPAPSAAPRSPIPPAGAAVRAPVVAYSGDRIERRDDLVAAEEPLEQIQKCILESVENFTRGARQADDLTMLLVRYLAASATAGASPVQSASAAEATATGT